MSNRKNLPAHVVLEGDGLLCRHCGKRETLFPMQLTQKRIKAMQLISESFEDEHAGCKENAQSPSVRSVESADMWLHGGDTGISSMTIWHIATNRPMPRGAWPGEPHDPSDFGRCHRLLEAFPWMKAKLPEVAAKYPAWSALVREWDTIEKLYLEELQLKTGMAPKTYELIKTLRAESGASQRWVEVR
jgi:hypothetical protein